MRTFVSSTNTASAASFFGGTYEAIASGAIQDGDPVVINSDGTVSSVAQTEIILEAAGTKMFFIGYGYDRVWRFNLSTAFDLTTASYNSNKTLTEEAVPYDLVFNNDGTKLFTIGSNGDRVYEYALSTAYQVTTISFIQNYSVSGLDTAPTGLAFNNDGSKLFIAGTVSDRVYELNLSTPFSLSSVSVVQNIYIGGNVANVRGLEFNSDGTKFFTLESGGDYIYEYEMSTGFDISTATYARRFYVGSQETDPQGFSFSADGTKMYILGTTSDSVFEYDLSTGFKVDTASYSGNSLSVSGQDSSPTGITFSKAVTGLETNLSTAYIGIADSAVSDGGTATIQVIGSIDDAQSGLTPGELYYVQQDGSLATTADTPSVVAGYALAPTKLLVKGAFSQVLA